jgi:hypothetical protein
LFVEFNSPCKGRSRSLSSLTLILFVVDWHWIPNPRLGMNTFKERNFVHTSQMFLERKINCTPWQKKKKKKQVRRMNFQRYPLILSYFQEKNKKNFEKLIRLWYSMILTYLQICLKLILFLFFVYLFVWWISFHHCLLDVCTKRRFHFLF